MQEILMKVLPFTVAASQAFDNDDKRLNMTSNKLSMV